MLELTARKNHLLVVELLLEKYGQVPDAIVALHINWALVRMAVGSFVVCCEENTTKNFLINFFANTNLIGI